MSQPASISPHTLCLSSSLSLLTLCVGVEFAALFVVFRKCYLWRGRPLSNALCACSVNRRCQVLVSGSLRIFVRSPYRDPVSTSTIYILDSRPRRTRYGLLGSLTPEPLFVNDPIPPLHAILTPVSVCTLYYLTKMSLNRLMSTYPCC